MDSPSQQNLNQLPNGTQLGDFKITGVIGEGGFGIVYLAYEPTLDRTVAIKEYLPSSIAGRTGNQSVMVRSQLNTNAFASGLKNFLREAQMLARFSHPALVEVHRVWEQNSTAYMAMRYYPGKTLRELRAGTTDFDEGSIRRLLEPVFDALSLLHEQNVIHRDVSPDNILLRGNGAPVLLDLGAARLVIGGMTQALTTVLKPGYAPIEQYVDDGTMHQGPWTDVYGLGAVLYYLLVGSPPPQAVARMITDPLKDIGSKSAVQVPQQFLDAVLKALAVRPENRYQSIDELREALGWTGEIQVEPRTTFVSMDPNAPPVRTGQSLRTGGSVSTGPKPQTAPTPPPRTNPPPARTAPTPQPATGAQPMVLDKVFAQDADATVVWKGPPVTLPPRAAPPPPPAPPAAGKAASASGPGMPRAKSYEEAGGSGSKAWIAIAAAIVAAAGGGGYYFMTRNNASTTPPVAQETPGTTSTPGTSLPPVSNTTPSPAPPPVAANTPAAPPPAPVPAPAPAPVATPPVATKPAVEPTKPVADAKNKEADDKAKRDAEERAAKLKADAADKAAKTKAEAEERAKIRARIEAEEKAAATARAEQEERARKAKQEEDDRAAAKARQDAEAAAKAAAANPGGSTARRSVDDLSSAGAAAFRRGDVSAARSAWNDLVNHPDATARSKAIAYNNLAVSYCQASDETTCERMYVSMFRADRNYGMEVNERELPAFKRAYDRAARAVRARY